MSIRHVIAAIFLTGGACVAHADVLPATGSGAQSGFLSGWTSGNGTDIVGSGVLSSGSTLIGGVAHGNEALAQALYDKASANQTGTQVKLSYAEGIEGSYLVGMSNAKLAAALGNNVSVVGSGNDIKVSTGQTGSNASGGSGAGGSTGAGGAPAAGGGTGGTGGTGNTGGGSVDAPVPPATTNPVGTPGAGDGTGGNNGGGLDTPADATPRAEVPEPSTMALLLAGVLGAVGIGRRRQR